jgi:hypothetical protein
MITLCTGALPRRGAAGVYQVIQYLRELSDNDDTFSKLPDEIDIPAVRISIPNISFVHELSGAEKKIYLKILDRNLRSPKVMLAYGDPDNPDIQFGETKTVLAFNPFRDIKRIEEYEGAPTEFREEDHILIKAVFENMEVTFLKWKHEIEYYEPDENESEEPNNELA